MAGAAYNPYDPVQQSFLGALALGESGGFSNPAMVGYGGADLSGVPANSQGFPQWSGVGNTHAAGKYQFQPSTWNEVASEHGLNFQNPSDQDAGAWYYAQDTYERKTGGDLSTDLKSGLFSKIQNALGNAWPSVFGNAANPHGLAGALGAGQNPDGSLKTAAEVIAERNGTESGGGLFATIENWFLRGGLIIVGLIIVGVALYFLMRDGTAKLSKGFG